MPTWKASHAMPSSYVLEKQSRLPPFLVRAVSVIVRLVVWVRLVPFTVKDTRNINPQVLQLTQKLTRQAGILIPLVPAERYLYSRRELSCLCRPLIKPMASAMEVHGTSVEDVGGEPREEVETVTDVDNMGITPVTAQTELLGKRTSLWRVYEEWTLSAGFCLSYRNL